MWIFHKCEAQVIYSLTTDQQPVIYWATHKSLVSKTISILTHKKRQKRKCILQQLPVFHHYMSNNPTKTFDCIRAFTYI